MTPTPSEPVAPDSTASNDTSAGVSLGQRFFRPQTLISFAIGLAIIAFAFSRLQIDVHGTLQTISTANWRLYIVALLVYYTVFPIRGLRWRLMLENSGYRRKDLPSLFHLSEIVFLSWFANCAVPAKLGDVYRAYLLRQRAALSFSKAGGTIVAERLLDLAILLILMGATALLSFHGRLPGPIAIALEVGSAAVVLAGLGLLGMRHLDGLVRRLVPSRFHGIYDHFAEGTIGAFGNYRALISLTVLAWAAEAGRLYFVTQALAITLSPNLTVNLTMVAFIALGSALLTAPPGTPAGLGYVEATMGWALITLGVGRDQAISVVILDRSISYGSLIVFGLIAYILSFRHADARRRAAAASQTS